MFLVKAVTLSSLVGVTPCPKEIKEGAIPPIGHFPGPLCSQRFHKPLRLASIKQNLKTPFPLWEDCYSLGGPSKACTKPKYWGGGQGQGA